MTRFKIHLLVHENEEHTHENPQSEAVIVRSRFFDLVDLKENPMKRVFALAFLFVSSIAFAQTTVTPAPTTPPPATDTGGGLSWLWLLVLLAIVAAAVWYFMKKRNTPTASGLAGVDRTATGTTTGTTTTGTTGTTTPPAGPNVYSTKDSKNPKR